MLDETRIEVREIECYNADDETATVCDEFPEDFNYLAYVNRPKVYRHEELCGEITDDSNKDLFYKDYYYSQNNEEKELRRLHCFVYLILFIVAVYTVILITQLVEEHKKSDMTNLVANASINVTNWNGFFQNRPN